MLVLVMGWGCFSFSLYLATIRGIVIENAALA